MRHHRKHGCRVAVCHLDYHCVLWSEGSEVVLIRVNKCVMSEHTFYFLVSFPKMDSCILSSYFLYCYKYNSVYPPSYSLPLLFSLAVIPRGLFSCLPRCCLCSTLFRVLSTSAWIFHWHAHIARPYSPVHYLTYKPHERAQHWDFQSVKCLKWYVIEIWLLI